jgi:hypothetical protein
MELPPLSHASACSASRHAATQHCVVPTLQVPLTPPRWPPECPAPPQVDQRRLPQVVFLKYTVVDSLAMTGSTPDSTSLSSPLVAHCPTSRQMLPMSNPPSRRHQSPPTDLSHRGELHMVSPLLSEALK